MGQSWRIHGRLYRESGGFKKPRPRPDIRRSRCGADRLGNPFTRCHVGILSNATAASRPDIDIVGEGSRLKPTAISDSAAESNAARVVSEDNLPQPEATGDAKSFV